MPLNGWKSTRLGDAFTSRRERGKAGLPMLSVTINDGLVNRSSLDRKMDSNLQAEEHLAVMPGDIAYNMMRMWQGASGMSDREGLVSPAYVVLKPNKIVDPKFIAYLFKAPRMIHLFWAYSYGLTSDRLRLYFKDFAAIPVTLPTLSEQRRIAEILSVWDHAIETTNKLIGNSQAQKNALMRTLLSGNDRLRGYRGKWRTLTLGSIGQTYSGLSGKSKHDFGRGQSFVPYKNVFENIAVDFEHLEKVQINPGESQSVIAHGDIIFTTSSETPEEVGMSSVAINPPNNVHLNSFCFGFRPKKSGILDPHFCKHFFRGPTVRRAIANLAQGSTRYNLSKRRLLKLPFQIPPVEEQRAIAAILNVLAADEIKLRESRCALQVEKLALMQQLLSGKRRVTVDKIAA